MGLATSAVLISLFVIASASAAIGPEFLVSEPSTGPAPFLRTAPRIASNGTTFLLVWADGRERNRSVRAARVNAAATVLDPLGLVIARQPGSIVSHSGPVVASDGRDYLVAYDCTGTGWGRICLARVTADGAVLPLSQILEGSAPSLAWDGQTYLLVYHSPVTGENRIYAQRLDTNGNTVGQPGDLGRGLTPAVAGAGGRSFVAWSSNDRIFGRLLGPEGSSAATHDLGATTYSTIIDVALSGNEFLVSWATERAIQARIIAADGVPRDPARTILTSARLPLGSVSATPDANGFTLVYSLGSEAPDPEGGLFSFRLNADGSASEPVREASGSENRGGDLAGGPVPMLAWFVRSPGRIYPGGEQILARPLTASRPSLVSSSTPSQHEPHAAVSGASTLVSWIEPPESEGTGTLFVVSNGNPRRYRIEERSASQSFARLSGGDSPMIFWLEAGELRGKRLHPWGQPIDLNPVVIAESATSLAAIATRDSHFVFYTIEKSVYLKRVRRDGLIVDTTPILVAQRPWSVILGGVATDGSGAALSWNVFSPVVCTCAPPMTPEYAVVSREGALIAGPRELSPYAAGNPQAVWNGSEYAMFTSALVGGSPQPTLRVQRVRSDGSLVDPEPRTIEGASPRMTSIAWNGSEYLSIVYNSYPTETISLERISADLRLSSRVSLQTSDDRRAAPFILARPGRSTLVVYEKSVLDVPYLGMTRIVGRSIDAPSRIRAARR